MRPTDLALLHTLASPSVHPDGQRVAVVDTAVDLDDDRYRSRILVCDGESTREFTHGPSDSAPAWSPDGQHLAFLRKGEAEEAKPQLVVMPADGGEARVLTDLPLGVKAFDWSPGSDRLVVVGTTWIEELAELEADERKRRPRRITTLPYRFDNAGWIHERRDHLYLVDVDGRAGDERQLTEGEHDETSPVWHPEGDRIAFVSRRHEDRDIRPGEQVFSIELDGGEVTTLTEEVGAFSGLRYAPDGTLHALGHPDVFDWPTPVRLLRISGGRAHGLSEALDRMVDAVRFTEDGRTLIAYQDRGRVVVGELDGDGKVTDLVRRDAVVSAFDVDPGGRTLAAVVTDATDAGELLVAPLSAAGDATAVTSVNAAFREEVELTEVHHFTYDRDGAEIDAWLLVPEGATAETPAPLLLNIHGGPTSQYDRGFFDEFQVYARAGYAVVGTNPRGSSGRGHDWMRAVRGVWHEMDSVDTQDLRAAVDAALDQDERIDPDRLGIMGGSYGGYATARILTVDDRFASSVVERGLLAWESFGGTSDIGPYFDRMFLDASLPEDAEVHRAASPTTLAGRITTPTLVLHSEEDWRCPIEQAEQLYVGLRRAGTETEFVRFPGEGHELSRSGSPKHRVERFDIILEWHDRHLKG